MANGLPYRWHFFRAGGFDQVRIESGADLLALEQLDQKLWVALSCPTKGLEFDERTLSLLDADGDGHVRAADLIAAAKWAGSRLSDAEVLATGYAGVPLAAIHADDDEGRVLQAAAKNMLAALDKPDATLLTVADVRQGEARVAEARFNGDGVVSPAQAEDDNLARAIQEMIETVGGVAGTNGETGINRPLLEQFMAEAGKQAEWRSAGGDIAAQCLGAESAAAYQAYAVVCDKVEDFFTRCRLAAFDARSAAKLNGAETIFENIASQVLSNQADDVAALPLAQIIAGQALPLLTGCNPAWQDRLAVFRQQALQPLLGERSSLTEAEWQEIKQRFTAYHDWAAAKPATLADRLDDARLNELLSDAVASRISSLLAEDEAHMPEVAALAQLEKLARYGRDLLKLANNFVSFSDFYSGRDKAIFQSGTLYLDGRSCDLCIPVADAAKHAALASLSRMCLVYCDCVRGSEKMSIAAAFTAGDSDQLMVGRNGVFYDRQGRDWDATIVRMLENPISLRQAFWLPYKRMGRMIGEQLQKLAASKAKAVDEKAAAAIADGSKKVEAAKPAAPAAFDVGKFAGIFAAIGLAVGALGTALASVITGLLGLKWWQMPLALAGLALAVSGPSMIIAWFKLRSRNLAPILDANGWAVNARARINIPFGASLTQVARLPEGAERSLIDPYAEKSKPWWLYFLLLAAAGGLVFWLGRSWFGW